MGGLKCVKSVAPTCCGSARFQWRYGPVYYMRVCCTGWGRRPCLLRVSCGCGPAQEKYAGMGSRRIAGKLLCLWTPLVVGSCILCQLVMYLTSTSNEECPLRYFQPILHPHPRWFWRMQGWASDKGTLPPRRLSNGRQNAVQPRAVTSKAEAMSATQKQEVCGDA